MLHIMNLNEINIEYINKFQYKLYKTYIISNNSVFKEQNMEMDFVNTSGAKPEFLGLALKYRQISITTIFKFTFRCYNTIYISNICIN